MANSQASSRRAAQLASAQHKTPPRVLTLDGDQYDGIWTQAIMYAPDEPHFRRSFFAANYVRGNELDVMPGPPVTIDREIVADLLNAPPWDALRMEVRQRGRDGIVAGYVMTAMFLIWKYPRLLGSRKLGGVSLNKAFHVVTYLGRELEWKFGDGSPFPTGETKIKQCWSKFRPVAHFWAADQWNLAFPFVFEHRALFSEKLGDFLSAARYFEMFGRERILSNKDPNAAETLLGDDRWRTPEGLRALLTLPQDERIFNDSPFAKALRTYAAR